MDEKRAGAGGFSKLASISCDQVQNTDRTESFESLCSVASLETAWRIRTDNGSVQGSFWMYRGVWNFETHQACIAVSNTCKLLLFLRHTRSYALNGLLFIGDVAAQLIHGVNTFAQAPSPIHGQVHRNRGQASPDDTSGGLVLIFSEKRSFEPVPDKLSSARSTFP